MDFREIVGRLNQLAIHSKVLKDLQIIRKQLRGLTRPGTYKIFNQRSTFNDDIPYAFHDGGRSELQFNVAVETYEDK